MRLQIRLATIIWRTARLHKIPKGQDGQGKRQPGRRIGTRNVDRALEEEISRDMEEFAKLFRHGAADGAFSVDHVGSVALRFENRRQVA